MGSEPEKQMVKPPYWDAYMVGNVGCPFCGADDAEVEVGCMSENVGPTMSREASCLKCGKDWHEDFERYHVVLVGDDGEGWSADGEDEIEEQLVQALEQVLDYAELEPEGRRQCASTEEEEAEAAECLAVWESARALVAKVKGCCPGCGRPVAHCQCVRLDDED